LAAKAIDEAFKAEVERIVINSNKMLTIRQRLRQKLGLKTLKILIRHSDCRVLDFLRRGGIEAEFKEVRISENCSTHLLKLSNPIQNGQLNDIPGSYMLLPGNYLWVAVKSCSSCKVLSNLPVIIESISYYEPSGIIAKVIVPGRLFQKKLIENLKVKGLDVEVLSVHDYIGYEFTQRQLEVLNTILKLGYLDSRKNVKIKDVAFVLGVDASTVSRIFKAAVKKVLLKTLG
jgi:DNA-binding Xre family transcriptional regulator